MRPKLWPGRDECCFLPLIRECFSAQGVATYSAFWDWVSSRVDVANLYCTHNPENRAAQLTSSRQPGNQLLRAAVVLCASAHYLVGRVSDSLGTASDRCVVNRTGAKRFNGNCLRDPPPSSCGTNRLSLCGTNRLSLLPSSCSSPQSARDGCKTLKINTLLAYNGFTNR